MILQKIRNYLFAEKHNGKKYGCGLKRDKKDERQLELGWSLFGYTPQHDVHVIETYDVKDQHYNTCGQEAAVACVETLKKTQLSEQFHSTMLRAEGKVLQDGFSSLVENLKALVKRGVCVKKMLNEDDGTMSYEVYTDQKKITPEMKADAMINRIDGFASVIGRPARLKTLDGGDVLYTGMDWYSGYNMNGGFSFPFIISKIIGWLVGGHAIFIKGYDYLRRLYIIQNSYGPLWGGFVDSKGIKHKGCFAVDMDFFDNHGFATYRLINIKENLAELLAKYDGKDVKGSDAGIYRIENGKKRAYLDKRTFYAFGGKFGPNKTWVPIAQSLLDQVTEGEQMKEIESPFWPLLVEKWDYIKLLAEPDNLKDIEFTINLFKNNGTMSLAKKYPVLGSSVNAEKISWGIKSTLVFIAAVAALKGIDIPQTDIDNIVFLVGTVLSGLSGLYGYGRKVYYWLHDKGYLK